MDQNKTVTYNANTVTKSIPLTLPKSVSLEEDIIASFTFTYKPFSL